MRVGIQSERDARQLSVMVQSRGIGCSSRTPRVRCSREIRMSTTTLVGVVGISGVTSRIGRVAEGVHVAIVSAMALTALTVDVVV